MLSVDITKQLGGFAIAAKFAAEPGVTALFGPSGAGKTSIVSMIAGLIAPDSGRIAVDGAAVFDRSAGIDVPAHKRRIGYVFQDGRLFPHMSVRANLDYGRLMQRLARDEAAMTHIVELLDLDRLLGRRPGKLSGGERQRVAIGRALLMQPRLLLLDEPFASLDEERKAEIFPYLERLRDELRVPMVYVSHRIEEVRRLATTMVRVEAGRVAGVETMDTVAAAS